MSARTRKLLLPVLFLAVAGCGPSYLSRLGAARDLLDQGSPKEARTALLVLAEEPPEEEAIALELADLLRRVGESRVAVGFLEPRRPDLSPAGLDTLAEALIRSGRGSDASTIVHGLVARAKDTARTRRLKGMLLLGEDQSLAAVRELKDSMKRDPDDPLTWAWLGIAHVRAGDSERGEALLREAFGRFPDSPDVRTRLAAAIQFRRPDTAETWREVIDLLTPAVAAAPHDRHPRHNLAIALRRTKRLAEAEAALRALTEDWPDEPTYWSDLGVVLVEREKLKEAVSTLERARTLAPRRLDILMNLGNAYLEVITVEFKRAPSALKAKAVFEEARLLAPQSADVLVGLARATLKSDPASDPVANEAMRLYREALALDPDHFAANLNLALLYYDIWMPNPEFQGEGRRKALYHFEKAAKKQPPETWNRHAREAYEKLR